MILPFEKCSGSVPDIVMSGTLTDSYIRRSLKGMKFREGEDENEGG